LNDAIYHQAIKDLAQQAHGSGRLAAPERRARLDNPLCGDRIDIELKLGEGGLIVALAHRTRGCLLCRASASILGLHAPGLSLAEIAAIRAALVAMLDSEGPPPSAWAELGLFLPVRAHPSRHGCVLLPLRALQMALDSHTASVLAGTA
jgi:nitrogen fixation protein NifU and related proteins